jgi:hypothetical protein
VTVTESQPLAALEIANRHRLAVAEKRREIAGKDFVEAARFLADLIETTEDDLLLSGRVDLYLRSLPRRGPRYVTRVLSEVGVRDSTRKLRDLTERQRLLLADLIRGPR